MNIDIKDTLTLEDDNKYVVAGKTNYENNIYYFLIDKDNPQNIKFFAEDTDNSNNLIEINDDNLLEILIPLFIKDAKDKI